MDIQLNITTTPQPMRNKPEKPKPFRLAKKPAGSSGGFSFQFGGGSQKVKAVVARKRLPAGQINKSLAFKPKRALTQDDITSGIRRYSENPNKQPRAADLLEQKEKEERAQKKRTEMGKVDAPEIGHVNKQARKVNAFRVKRAADSSVKKINLFQNNPEAKEIGQRLVKPITERLFDGTKVDSLGLHPHAVKNLQDLLGITELTTVQRKAIPKALEGKDILVRSQTGSGKTLAYALPIVEKLQEMRPKISRDAGILAVVIVPTRELAIQTYELFVKLLKPYTWIVPGVLMGGERRKAEKARLRKGINILVGTPGRLVDHLLHTESFKLSKSKFLILDEADRLLEMGYERDVKQIVEAIDKQRTQLAEETKEAVVHLQRLLLSATLTTAVQRLAGLTLQAPIFIDNSDADSTNLLKNTNGYAKESIEAATQDLIDTDDETGVLTIPENLKLSYIVVPPKLRLVTLSGLLAKEFKGKEKLKAMVFMSTMEMVNFHHDMLNEQLTQKVLDEDDEEVIKDENHVESDDDDDDDEPLLMGLRFFKLHGSMSQTERQGVFNGYRECKSGVLLTTDVSGRGIDVPEVDLVVQYSPPQKIADFVHRVGRTARAGRNGRAVLFLAPNEAKFVRKLEDNRIRISQVNMDVYLQALKDADDVANTVQEAASNLQHKFELLIVDDKEMREKACKAFVSWMKFYSTFPKELKPIFSVKNAHMGHFAKSFGLKDPPTSFTKKHSLPKQQPPTNRLTYTERDPERIKVEKETKKRRFATTVTDNVRNMNRPVKNVLLKMLPTSRALNTSEFDSGLPPIKKRK
ncbi:probable ATP-dependent RNA helicase CG8611 [Teleopsis dalmanni]|uniref:probable ATP-dependent RNA helicase CG8611 n=1 Tax=Teleopsis dalmanni TaxID=139649 RepID=UPI0018CCB99B|nr:probable ATP-dependent RNA helicase CG8611 [Teleopsis dalmanni]